MTATRSQDSAPWTCFAFLIGGLSAIPLQGEEPILSRGVPVNNMNWGALVTSSGYMDLVIDERMGFDGREYLSGEWAPAISYDGHPPMWLARWHVFPDWATNSDLLVLDENGDPVPVDDFAKLMTTVWFKDQMNPFNKDGFPVFQSRQRNDHIEITHQFEMCNAQDLAQGLSPNGGGGQGDEMISGDGFAFLHTLTFRNISDVPLADFVYYHLVHSLHASYVVYDDTDHGGAMSEYRFDFTQRGSSYSIHSETRGVYRHLDYLTLHSKVPPDAFEVGYYGMRGVDEHDIGKPSVGVHLAIENNTFSNLTEFEPESGGWVAGAARFPLGTIGVGESQEFSLLLSLRTMSEMVHPDIGIVIEPPVVMGDRLRIPFHDTHDLFNEAGLFFGLEASVTMLAETWMPQGAPFQINPQMPGQYSFEIPYDPAIPQNHFRITLNPGF